VRLLIRFTRKDGVGFAEVTPDNFSIMVVFRVAYWMKHFTRDSQVKSSGGRKKLHPDGECAMVHQRYS